MPKFFVRVELHDADWPEDYETLHDEMEAKGLHRWAGVEGRQVALPSGDYCGEFGDPVTAQQVARTAEMAADATDYDNEIVVSESSDVAAIGLADWVEPDE